jgi:acyl-CoA hydrolase
MHTNSAFAVFVAMDESGRPTTVPPLILETDEDRRRWEEGEGRQQLRLQRWRKKV